MAVPAGAVPSVQSPTWAASSQLGEGLPLSHSVEGLPVLHCLARCLSLLELFVPTLPRQMSPCLLNSSRSPADPTFCSSGFLTIGIRISVPFLWPPALPVISDASKTPQAACPAHTVSVQKILHGIKTECLWPAFPFSSLLRWRWSCEPLGLGPSSLAPSHQTFSCFATFHVLPLGGYLTSS